MNKVIVLAAGQDSVLDGIIKCLIRHPSDGKTILEHALAAVGGMKVTVVVGYRAIEIMQAFPHLDYVFNDEWSVTNNSYSLGLALTGEPCLVVSGDILFNHAVVEAMLAGPPDLALTSRRENRCLTAIHSICRHGRLVETYMGQLKDASHDELLGIYKISSPRLLARWKETSMHHSNLFCGQTLPLAPDLPPIKTIHLPPAGKYHEINTVADYMRLIAASV